MNSTRFVCRPIVRARRSRRLRWAVHIALMVDRLIIIIIIIIYLTANGLSTGGSGYYACK